MAMRSRTGWAVKRADGYWPIVTKPHVKHKPGPKTLATMSIPCQSGKHQRCYKLSCTCDCGHGIK